MAEVITVSALNRYVKTLLDANDALFDLALRGEIANFVQNARSGHCYFSLRDDVCSVKAVMFRTDARRLAFRPEEGMRVVVRCRATLYERDGAFQLYVNDMFPDGIGAAQLALEQLKAKLEQEGLFAPEHKKPLPEFPKCIGVVTSKWQYLNSYTDGIITADTAGRYLLTNQNLKFANINWTFFIAGGVVVVLIGIAYVVLKKRYWFW